MSFPMRSVLELCKELPVIKKLQFYDKINSYVGSLQQISIQTSLLQLEFGAIVSRLHDAEIFIIV